MLTGLAVMLLIGGCATQQPPIGEAGQRPSEVKSPIVAREKPVRSRIFEAATPTVFDSVMSVFEDLGYTIHRADRNAGMITAEGTVNELSRGLSLGSSQKEQDVASALVEDVGENTRVILNFALRSHYSGVYGKGEGPEVISFFETGVTDDSYSFETTVTFDDYEPMWDQQTVLDADLYRDAFDRIGRAINGRS